MPSMVCIVGGPGTVFRHRKRSKHGQVSWFHVHADMFYGLILCARFGRSCYADAPVSLQFAARKLIRRTSLELALGLPSA
eukprot:4000747-Amphidinium_carterae.2